MFRNLGVVLVVAVAGVATAGAGGREKAGASREFTLGLVQKALRPGLSQADVAERLGSPNIVTRGADGREAWVYDKVSSEVEASSGGVSVGGLGSGAGNTFAGMLGIAGGKRSEKARFSQKTLTVVIRFSTAGGVESFTWHVSRF
jgi:hypothetical protein